MGPQIIRLKKYSVLKIRLQTTSPKIVKHEALSPKIISPKKLLTHKSPNTLRSKSI